MTTDTQKPAHTIRRNTVCVSIWKHENPKGVNFSISLERRYQNRAGEWKSTKGFFRQDVQHVTAALQEAEAWIASQKRAA
jgi:hypothetical protein